MEEQQGEQFQAQIEAELNIEANHAIKDFIQCIYPSTCASAGIFASIKSVSIFNPKKHFKDIEERIGNEKSAIISKIKALKKLGDEAKRKVQTIGIDEKVLFIVSLSNKYKNELLSHCKPPACSFFYEGFEADLELLKKDVLMQLEQKEKTNTVKKLMYNFKNEIKVSLYRVWNTYLTEASSKILELLFSEVLNQKYLDTTDASLTQSDRLISDILKNMIMLLTRIQLERNYAEIKALEKLSQNISRQKQRSNMLTFASYWFLKTNGGIDISAFPYKNIFIFIFLLITLILQLSDQYPSFQSGRAFLKFLQHDPAAIYIILV
jgi:hypothetical protein